MGRSLRPHDGAPEPTVPFPEISDSPLVSRALRQAMQHLCHMVQDFPVVHLVPVSRRLFSQVPEHLVLIEGAQRHDGFRNFFRRLNQLSVSGFPKGPFVFRHLLVDVRNLNPLLIPFVSHNRVRAHQPAFRQSILHVAAAHARLQ